MRGKNNPNFGKPMSTEQKIKLSIAHKGKCAGKNNPRYGKIESKLIRDEEGNIIRYER